MGKTVDDLAERETLAERECLIDLAVDSWKFARLFQRVLLKLDPGEANRYAGQHRYHVRRLEENLQAVGMQIVNLEGQPYNPGVAAAALNLSEFGSEDELIVEQMLEPVIMGPDGLVRGGTVMLRQVGQ